MQRATSPAAAATDGDIKFPFSADDAARISLCSVMHGQVLKEQLIFLRQQLSDFQKQYGKKHADFNKLSIDRHLPKMKVLGRTATDFEASLASLFDHNDKISLLTNLHIFAALMCRARSVIAALA